MSDSGIILVNFIMSPNNIDPKSMHSPSNYSLSKAVNKERLRRRTGMYQVVRMNRLMSHRERRAFAES